MAYYIRFVKLGNSSEKTSTHKATLPEIASASFLNDNVPSSLVAHIARKQRNYKRAQRQREHIGLYKNSSKIDELRDKISSNTFESFVNNSPRRF